MGFSNYIPLVHFAATIHPGAGISANSIPRFDFVDFGNTDLIQDKDFAFRPQD